MNSDNEAIRMLAAYPGADKAISFVELMLCSPVEGDDETAWDLLVKAYPNDPQGLAKTIRQMIAEEDTDGADLGKVYLGRMREAHTQTFHADFLKYLSGKMGMV